MFYLWPYTHRQVSMWWGTSEIKQAGPLQDTVYAMSNEVPYSILFNENQVYIGLVNTQVHWPKHFRAPQLFMRLMSRGHSASKKKKWTICCLLVVSTVIKCDILSSRLDNWHSPVSHFFPQTLTQAQPRLSRGTKNTGGWAHKLGGVKGAGFESQLLHWLTSHSPVFPHLKTAPAA